MPLRTLDPLRRALAAELLDLQLLQQRLDRTVTRVLMAYEELSNARALLPCPDLDGEAV